MLGMAGVEEEPMATSVYLWNVPLKIKWVWNVVKIKSF